ncbi:alternative oxidase [Legionella cincinnatiensis]|uniref:Oxidase n=1 Tax=Legionella cincinnatiensis TaxID=28085 RepID=A0A378IXI9_9GAMM|nr:alternative oxidase [Legionella cincinnatiensis]KTC83303.1 oxidase [Legionella cincinnatiensis]STX36714.1 oxidase [Legionella cincinnatiensis]
MSAIHKPAKTGSDKFAFGLVKFFRFFADTFFQKRYGNRAIVLETVAAVPGMVGAALLHLRCLRKIKNDEGWIKTLLDEAENERMHLITFMYIAKPNWFERAIIFIAQAIFVVLYLLMYILSSKTAHRFVGYLEEEAVISYTHYLQELDEGRIENSPAPDIAKSYWGLASDACLRDVLLAVRVDEEEHRDVNHQLADKLATNRTLLTKLELELTENKNTNQ